MHPMVDALERRLLLAATPSLTLSFNGFSTSGGANDSDVAMGPNHMVIVANNGIRFYRKDGTQLYTASLGEFFNAGPYETRADDSHTRTGQELVGDPRVMYDTSAGRFVLSMHTVYPGGELLLAVSNDADPTEGATLPTDPLAIRRGTWNRLSISTGNALNVPSFSDFPVLAIGTDAVYVTALQLPQDQSPFGAAERLWIIRKTDFYDDAGDGFPDWRSFEPIHVPQGSLPGLLVPTEMYGTPTGTVGTYLIYNDGSNNQSTETLEVTQQDTIKVIRVDNPLAWVANPSTSPTFTLTEVPLGIGVEGNDWRQTPWVPPPQGRSSSAFLSQGVCSNAVWRDGFLWVTHVGTPFGPMANGAVGDLHYRHPEMGQRSVHWAKVSTATMANSDQGWIGGENILEYRDPGDPYERGYATNTETGYPSIDVNAAGDGVITFTAIGEKIFVGGYYALRRAGDAAGTFRDPAPLAEGTGYHARFDTKDGRVEDYSGTALDPSDDTRFWMYDTYTLPPLGQNGDIPTALSRVGSISVTPVVNRQVFYDRSHWDGSDVNAVPVVDGPNDDGAIAPYKQALLRLQTATFANYTSYSKGLNGIVVDIKGLPAGVTPTVADFEFRAGNDSNPAAWPLGPTPSSITVRRGAGFGGTDRITLKWNDFDPADPNSSTRAVGNKWLRVTVKATSITGLSEPDVFYFGNLIGDTGINTTGAYATLAEDYSATHAAYDAQPGGAAPITSMFDYNRDGLLTTADYELVRANYFKTLLLLSAPV